MSSHLETCFTQSDIESSYQFCKKLAKDNSNFYMGMLFAPKEKRKQLFSIYAWMRAVDDIADEENTAKEIKLKSLQAFSEVTHQVANSKIDTSNPLLKAAYWPAFYNTIQETNFPLAILEGMIKGQMQDLEKNNYKTFTELYDYCCMVSSTVGLSCIYIWGYVGGKNTELLAEKYGIAIQLTNILRDITEDLKSHRVYLPAEFVDMNELTYKNFETLSHQQRLIGIKKLIEKTDFYYHEASDLINHINKHGRLSFLLLIAYYKAIFIKIRNKPEIVLSGKKVKLSFFKKVTVILKTMFKAASSR